ncbi:MAG: BON domain-containing protein [Aquabacterium sp.]|nr:BON domain-containing protein [Aquabacterium sp.]
MINRSPLHPTRLRWVALLMALASLSACAPLVLGTAVGSAFMATDRRTSGTQLEDQGIELKAANRVREVLGERGHVSINAYNRQVLVTGEVPTEEDKAAVGNAISRTDTVTGVVNELLVGVNSSLSTRSSDLLIASKVKATFIDARDIFANAFDIVVDRGDVYLLGLVTEREAQRAAELAASIRGVNRVIKVLQIISEDELARKLPRQP